MRLKARFSREIAWRSKVAKSFNSRRSAFAKVRRFSFVLLERRLLKNSKDAINTKDKRTKTIQSTQLGVQAKIGRAVIS